MLNLETRSARFAGAAIAQLGNQASDLTATYVWSNDLTNFHANGATSSNSPICRTSAADPGNYEVVSVPYPVTVPVTGGGAEKTPHFFRVGVENNAQ